MYIFLYLVFVHAISGEPLNDKPCIWRILRIKVFGDRVAEVAREHGWHPPKSLDSDENFKP